MPKDDWNGTEQYSNSISNNSASNYFYATKQNRPLDIVRYHMYTTAIFAEKIIKICGSKIYYIFFPKLDLFRK